MRTINGISELMKLEGEDLGASEWHEVTQEAVNAFADVTGDHQFIHVDPEKAAQTPFGGTIAHGYYTLSLAPKLCEEVVSFTDIAFAVNYGLDKVRFPAPLPVGSKVRVRMKIAELKELPGNGVQVKQELTFEAEGGDKPVCVAEALARFYGTD